MAEERKKDKKTLEKIATESKNPAIQKIATQAVEKEFEGDEVAQKMIRLAQIMAGIGKGADIDEEQVKQIVREQIETEKISLDNLDSVVRQMIEDKPVKLQLTITTPAGTVQKTVIVSAEIKRPLMQKVLSDVLARNNVYLYGGAGTGKTFSAQVIADTLGWELIEISCNQFTSPLELIGGQTIDGYQEGKVIKAYGNKKGAVLLLDELPKIDPNTAGILNQALARVAEFKPDGTPKSIENGRGQKIERGNVFIMATGNALLNTKDPEYEANFKQDLSLQDRFVGSTYEVFVDVGFEWEHILNKKWAFIAIYLNNLRNLIFKEGFQAKAFVSVRIMQSVQKTYNVYRSIVDTKAKSKTIQEDPDVSYTPAPYPNAISVLSNQNIKTIENSMDEFFSLFNEDQSDKLKADSDYTQFLKTVQEKNRIPMDKLNTPQELKEMDRIVADAKAKHKY